MTEPAAESSAADGAEGPAPDAAPDYPILLEPVGGTPPIIDTPAALVAAAADLARGTGPVAVDAERASGFRYGQRTYLAQFKRADSRIALVDTAALRDFAPLAEAIGDVEWVLHAASQDLPGLADIGLTPPAVFDTELAARLLGWPKVGLAAVVERVLGISLAKEHSAQDWSQRPLPQAWLTYAALDVEVLLDVRDAMAAELEKSGKAEWARQEFEAVRLAPPAPPRPDPWRRTSGSHTLRDRRALAIVRALWEAREEAARARDTSPGRVLRDAAIIAAAQARPASLEALLEVREFQSKGTKRRAAEWYGPIKAAMDLEEADLPAARGPRGDGPPQPRLWADKRPDAAARLEAARAVIAEITEKHAVPAENLLQPDALRRLCWEYAGGGAQSVRAFLAARGARAWQIDLTADALAAAFALAEAAAAAATEGADAAP